MMKWWKWLLYVLMMVVLFTTINQYFFCPQYYFKPSSPFYGSTWYNPYQDDDTLHWRKCNFHAHVKSWSGVTNGKGDAADASKIYDSLGYDVHVISNYESISDFGNEKQSYIPAYEHGYGMCKNHHGILGASHVVWNDYFLPQTLSNKQHILSLLPYSDSTFIIINHPDLRNGFPPADMNWLSGYDGMEGFAHGSNSFAAWDAALSAGKPVFIVGTDDVHNVDNPAEVAVNCTWVYATNVTRSAIIQGLKKGNGYAMKIGSADPPSFESKMRKVNEGYPMLKQAKISGDTLIVTMNKKANSIRFIGQEGDILEESSGISARYQLRFTDTYVRTMISFDDGTVIALNPVFRTDGKTNTNDAIPEINTEQSTVYRVLGAIILLLFGLIPFYLRLSRK
jgi:hypothetical protein